MVLELDPLAAVDRGVDLRQARGDLAAAGRGGDPEPDRLPRVRAERARAAPGDLLQREPQRLGVGELAVEQRQRGLQRGALGVGERDRREVEGLGRERVVLLLGEAVRGLVDGEVDSERVELRPVRIETPRERILGHVRVALDVAPDLGSRDGTPLRHQIGDQRQLADELFGVLRQTLRHLRVPREPYSSAAAEIPPLRRVRVQADTPADMPLRLVLIEDHQALREGSRAAARTRGHRGAGHGRAPRTRAASWSSGSRPTSR